MSSRFASTKTFIYALFTLTGTIIGVGIFVLPFVTTKVGILTMLFYFLVLGTVVLIVHLLFMKIAVKAKGLHRLPGYAQIYLGKKGKLVASGVNILGLVGALLAYLIVGGNFIHALPLSLFGGNLFLSTLLFFTLGAILIYFGIKSIAKVELFAFLLFLAILFYLLAQGHYFLAPKNLFNFQSSELFLPYGIILFALWGAALVPEVTEMLKKKTKSIKKVIFLAILLSTLVYLFFIILIAGISGELTSKDAISGLKYFFPDTVMAIALSFGVLTCFTSFITLGLTLKKVFWYDFKIKKDFAWFLACFSPFFLYSLGIKDFIKVISLIGGIMLGIEAILIILIYLKIREKEQREFLPIFHFKNILFLTLALFFLFGIIYEIIYFLGA